MVQLLERITSIDISIRHKSTGTPKDLAKKISISRSHLYNYISVLKTCGALVKYSRCRRTFYYEKPFEFNSLNVYNVLTAKNLVPENPEQNESKVETPNLALKYMVNPFHI